MGMNMTAQDYVLYLIDAGKVIAGEKDYVTALDSKTGDGDHWVNLNMGFEKVAELSGELKTLPLSAMLKKVGMTMMASVGGSSGALYGSAYIAAGKAAGDSSTIDAPLLHTILVAMRDAIMQRGKAEPGYKTMLDSLHQAAVAMKATLDSGADDAAALLAMKEGAKEGMEATRDMEAVKGRASYQANKGVGDLDPGAYTMYLQLNCLADHAMKTL